MFRNLFLIVLALGALLMGGQWLMEDPHFFQMTEKLPASSLTPKIIYTLGELFFDGRRYPKAVTYFDYYLTHFPKSPDVEKADYFRLEALRYGFLKKPAQLNQERQAFLDRYPNSPYSESVRRLMF